MGKLAANPECWFFWEKAGLQRVDVARTLPASNRDKPVPLSSDVEPLHKAHAGGGKATATQQATDLFPLPLLRAVAGTHGTFGDERLSLDRIPVIRMMGAPLDWCPNPAYTSLLRVRGNSMEPLIHEGDILAVDSFQNDASQLDGKVVVAASEEKGLCVSHLRRYQDLDVLESENHAYEAVVLARNSGWRILARVLWWISVAP